LVCSPISDQSNWGLGLTVSLSVVAAAAAAAVVVVVVVVLEPGVCYFYFVEGERV